MGRGRGVQNGRSGRLIEHVWQTSNFVRFAKESVVHLKNLKTPPGSDSLARVQNNTGDGLCAPSWTKSVLLLWLVVDLNSVRHVSFFGLDYHHPDRVTTESQLISLLQLKSSCYGVMASSHRKNPQCGSKGGSRRLVETLVIFKVEPCLSASSKTLFIHLHRHHRSSPQATHKFIADRIDTSKYRTAVWHLLKIDTSHHSPRIPVGNRSPDPLLYKLTLVLTKDSMVCAFSLQAANVRQNNKLELACDL